MSSWEINPSTGDYVMANGAPVPSEDLKYPAYYRVRVRRNQWLYAPDRNYGSDYYLLRTRVNGRNLSSITAIGQKALKPIVDDGRASDAEVSFDNQQQQSRHNQSISVSIVDSQGQVEELNLVPIG